MVIAILVGLWLTIKLDKKYKLGLGQEKIFDLAIWLIVAGVIGARSYHVLSDINYYWPRPLTIFYLWRGGLGIFGAVIAGIIFLCFYTRRQRRSIWLFLDLLAPAIILGEAIGRFGNWFNQENFGRPTSLSWGIPIDIWHRPIEYLAQNFFHPTFLYQFFWNVIIFIILLLLMKRWRPGTGMIVGFYLIFYSLGRFLIEFLRINAQPMLFGLRLAQI
ncbi:MAG: prolipoprotein diacylglyceryl transferase, partial [Candidatus Parcubacteria bacterium]|nr:prolipoprotein diacylglyceryl transferase [Candidatus Parcubacteria bacterium]